MLPDPIKLWKTRTGRECLLSAPGSQPPFKVLVLDGPEVVKEAAFDDHNDAAAFAIAEMRAAFNYSPYAD